VSRVRVLLVDDQGLFREGLRTILSTHAAIEVVGEASNGEEALRVAAATRPDVVLMDLKMPVLDGPSATRALREARPECKVIALTTFDDDEWVFEGLRAGAVGYLLKDTPSARIVEAIQAAARGASPLEPAVAAKVLAELARLSERGDAARDRAKAPEPAAGHGLSDREVEVLRLVVSGAANKEIAATLRVTEGTVKNHLTSVFSKLGVQDRTQAALRARALGIA
jgi:DNA-binding NarL/FixJ family response regulator